MDSRTIITDEDVIRFHTKYIKMEPDKCWSWQGTIHPNGYGAFKLNGIPQHAHRVMWYCTYGPFDWIMEICHKCDNQLCVNPSHLFIGTHGDNMKDRDDKDRQSKGELHGMAFLTEQSVLQMIQLSKEGVSARKIARRFKVSHVQAWRIVTGKRWSYLNKTTTGMEPANC